MNARWQHARNVPETTVDALPDPLPADVAVLDVREPDEWAAGHVPGAVHIPLAELPGRVDLVPAGQVLVVCRSGAPLGPGDGVPQPAGVRRDQPRAAACGRGRAPAGRWSARPAATRTVL